MRTCGSLGHLLRYQGRKDPPAEAGERPGRQILDRMPETSRDSSLAFVIANKSASRSLGSLPNS